MSCESLFKKKLIFASSRKNKIFYEFISKTKDSNFIEVFLSMTLGRKKAILETFDIKILTKIFPLKNEKFINKKEFLKSLELVRRIRNYLSHNSWIINFEWLEEIGEKIYKEKDFYSILLNFDEITMRYGKRNCYTIIRKNYLSNLNDKEIKLLKKLVFPFLLN